MPRGDATEPRPFEVLCYTAILKLGDHRIVIGMRPNPKPINRSVVFEESERSPATPDSHGIDRLPLTHSLEVQARMIRPIQPDTICSPRLLSNLRRQGIK